MNSNIFEPHVGSGFAVDVGSVAPTIITATTTHQRTRNRNNNSSSNSNRSSSTAALNCLATVHNLCKSKTSTLVNSLCVLTSFRFSQFWASSRHVQLNLGMYKFRLLEFEEITPNSKLNPKARSGHRMVADESGDLYSFGGFNVKVPADDGELSREPEWQKFKPLFQELWKFNWRTKRWRKLRTTGDIPDKLVSHCMCYWNEKIIIYGGTGLPFGDNSSNRLTMYHPAQNHWEIIEPLSEPSRSPLEMYGQACVCDEQRGELYVVGGTNGSQYSLDVHKFNLYTKKWTVLYKSEIDSEDQPGCRYRHEIALHNNKLYLFGGSTSVMYYAFDKLHIFDLETLDWTYCKPKPDPKQSSYPSARKCHSLAVIGSDCYICGGTNGSEVCSDLWHINLDELKWTLLVQRIPYPVYFHGASVSLGGKLTIFGGVDTISGDSRNDRLTSIWLKIPSLKNICLSAVNYYTRHGLLDSKSITSTGLDEALEVADLV